MFRLINNLVRKRKKTDPPQEAVLFSPKSRLAPGTRFINGIGDGCHLELGPGAWIDKNAELDISFASIRVGEGSFIHSGACIYGDVTIGDHCLISKNLYASSGGHSISKPCYIRHCDHIDPRQHPSSPIFIHDDVWIGYNVFLKAGVTIGKGAVIGALSAVTKDIPPYTVVGGVPARWIKNRYSYEPPANIRSASEEHFPYFYSGFDQVGMESCLDGYLVVRKKVRISAPDNFLGGQIIVSGNTINENRLSLDDHRGYSIASGSFRVKYELTNEGITTLFHSKKFIQLEVASENAGTRITEVAFVT